MTVRGLTPDFVAEIAVIDSITEEVLKSGTCYPIAPDRIITAAHVVFDPETKKLRCSNPRIRVTFRGSQFPDPVWAETDDIWNGLENGDLDVAVLLCECPSEILPFHAVAEEPLSGAQLQWHSAGYSVAAEHHNLCDDASGDIGLIGSGEESVKLMCDPTKSKPEEWRGMSGAPVFRADSDAEDGRPLFIGIITDYLDISDDDHFTAIPIWALLKQDGFAEAIRLQRLQSHGMELTAVQDEIQIRCEELGKIDAARKLYLQSFGHAVEQSSVELTKVPIPKLRSGFELLQRKLSDSRDADSSRALEIVHEIQDYTFPLRYSEPTVASVRKRLESGLSVLVQGAVFHSCVAEVLMAAVDGRETRFRIVDNIDEPQAALGLECPMLAAEGPDDASLGLAVQLIKQLCTQSIDQRPLFDDRTMTALQRDCEQKFGPFTPTAPNFAAQIQYYGRKLQKAIAEESDANDGSTLYCVVDLSKLCDLPGGATGEQATQYDDTKRSGMGIIEYVNGVVRNLTFLEQVIDTDVAERERPFYRCLTRRVIDRRTKQ